MGVNSLTGLRCTVCYGVMKACGLCEFMKGHGAACTCNAPVCRECWRQSMRAGA